MTQKKIRFNAIVLAATLLVSAATSADVAPSGTDATANERPRIGLVLGGGGARGAAHIGVLRELERQRIPIDAIAGTSMGAVVGGLYASGMTPDELEQLVSSLDWADALSDDPNRENLPFRRKQDDEQYPIDLELGLDHGEFRLPLGLIQGQKLDLILRDLTFDVAHIRDFDELPIPFRAIASDIERGESVVMSEGDLAIAMRASMSVPGVIAPVRVGDRMLVDGGLVGNLPVDVLRDMDVDVIIAVDVEFPLYSIEELQSAIAISEQMLTILIHKETLRQIETLDSDDILIQPDLGKFGSADFGAIVDTIEPGMVATRAVEPQLRALSVDVPAYAAWRENRAHDKANRGTLTFVRVEHDSKLSSAVLESRLDVVAGDPIDAMSLAAAANRLYGMAVFEKVDYRLIGGENGTGVEFDAHAKTWGPSFLRFDVALEDDFEGATNFNVGVRLTRPVINRNGGELRADLRLGTEPQLFTELYQPLPVNARFFVAPYLDFGQTNLNLFSMDDIAARLRITELTGGIDFGAEVGDAGELRLGAFRGGGESRVIIGDPTIPNPDFETGGLRALLRFDTRDNAWFPRQGLRAGLEWLQSMPGLGADDDYDTVIAGFDSFWSRGKSTFGAGIEFGTTLSYDGAVQDLFPLGGFLRLSGFERGAVSGPHAAITKLVFYRRIGDSAGGLFEAPTYFGASLEAGNAWQTRSEMSFDSALVHGSVFIGMDTFIGPLYLAGGLGQDGHSNFYLYIGAPPL